VMVHSRNSNCQKYYFIAMIEVMNVCEILFSENDHLRVISIILSV